ncbi:MAG: tRNA pseudouridine(55) synthase TruB [Lachnospiraceae bacterium]|nr:tRNA pseudouridine(55) synthase TruB [Lachnospiraceae bacterium]
MYHGIINIYKEAGYTSHDVVAKLRGILGQKKIGHTGTLDPDATGVLPVCLGVGTKLCDMLTDEDKEYVAELYLGVTTDTQDMTGTVLSHGEVSIDEERLKEIIYSFQGEYEQLPPMYSALKVNGKKLYELAREGKTVERRTRNVRIEEIEILEIRIPIVKMRVVCSKGTYIRTLCDDIGKKAGCGGAMKSLERTRVGRFLIKDTLTLGRVQELVTGDGEDRKYGKTEVDIEDYIISPDGMFPELDKLKVKKEYHKLLQNGNCLDLNMVYITKSSADTVSEVSISKDNLPADGERFCVYDETGKFYGIYRFEGKDRVFMPVKMFITDK